MDKDEEEEEEEEEEEGGSVKRARTLERAWNKSMMNVQLAVFNQGSKQGLSVWAASLSRLKLSQAHKATSAGCINYSKRTVLDRSLGYRHIKRSRMSWNSLVYIQKVMIYFDKNLNIYKKNTVSFLKGDDFFFSFQPWTHPLPYHLS